MNNTVKLVDDLKKFILGTPELYDSQDLLFAKMDSLLIEQSKLSEKFDREFTFDLHRDWLKQYYSATSPENAWRDVRKFMLSHNFSAKSDTDYITNEPLTSIEFSMVKNELRNKYPWFEICTTKIISSTIDEHFDTKKEWEISRTAEELNKIKEDLSRKVQEAAELIEKAKQMKEETSKTIKANKSAIENATTQENVKYKQLHNSPTLK